MKKLLPLFFLSIFSTILYSQNCNIQDKPDKLFQDINFDGIDGDISNAVFVSTNDGNDSNDGSFSNPVKSIKKGIEIAVIENKDVYVAFGSYYLNETLAPASGISIYGQFSGLPDWQRSNDYETVIYGTTTAIIFQDISEATNLEGFSIYSDDATAQGESSVGIKVVDCSGNVIIKNNIIFSGAGMVGANGENGTNGTPGGPGTPGTSGTCDGLPNGTGGTGGNSACGNYGGSGGHGGIEGPHDGNNGNIGVGNTPGGAGGSYGDPGEAGQSGQNGAHGVNGTNGAPVISQINISSIGQIIPSNGNNGTNGANGNGGGGGGGGGAQECSFCGTGSGNGGSGGGGGGCGGNAGIAGTGGGSSIGLVVVNSHITIEQNSILTSNGGNGGNGGNAGEGGNGGNGATTTNICTDEIGAGGNGGNGGDGGNGGAASGAQGGHSIGIFISTNSIAQISDNIFTIADPGIGGLGGIVPDMGMPAANGPAGVSNNIYGNFTNSEIISPDLCSDNILVAEPMPSEQSFAVFNIILNEPPAQIVSVDYQTVSGSAIEDINYSNTSGTLTFYPDEMIKSVEIEVFNDLQITENIQFSLQFSNANNLVLSNNESFCTITDSGFSSNTQTEFSSPRIFPNPANNYFRIKSDSQNLRYIIRNTRGVTISSGIVLSDSEVDISQLNPGVYFITILNDGVVNVKKLTIVK